MGCVVNRRRGGDGTPPLCDAVNKYRARHTRQRKDPRQPRRGRRPRRPLPTSIADLTAFRQPPRRGGVPPPPGVRSPPALRHREGAAGGGGRPQRGGTPGGGSPFDPLLRFFGDGAFRALRRAARGSAPGPRPLFCKKAGQKTFKWLDLRLPESPRRPVGRRGRAYAAMAMVWAASAARSMELIVMP